MTKIHLKICPPLALCCASALDLFDILGDENAKCDAFFFHFCLRMLFIYFSIYINKNETRCRDTTMPLLTTLSQLVLFEHHVTADHRAPLSSAGAVT